MLILLIGFIAGFVGALLGIGGGVIIVPSLSLFLGIPIHSAIAISIFAVAATGMAGAARYIKQGLTDIKLGIYLETMTVLGVALGVHLALLATPEFLYLVFSILLYYLALTHLFTVKKEETKLLEDGFEDAEKEMGLSGSYYDKALGKEVRYSVKGAIRGSLLSFFAGIGSGLLGIGGGVFKVAAMNLLMNVPLKVSVATSKFMIGITAGTGALLYMLSGSTPLLSLAPAAMGTIIGATLGSKIMNRIRSRYLKYILFLLMMYLGINMMLKGLAFLGW